MDYCGGYTYETFVADTKLVEACVFNLRLVWEIISEDIPTLKDTLEKLVRIS